MYILINKDKIKKTQRD